MTLPDKLTAAEFERLKAQEQRMLNSGSWVPQAENTWAAEMNVKEAEDAAPVTMTADQADAAEAQQSVAAETSFGRSMGARPDYSSGPAVNPADSEPKTIEELRRKQQELYHDPTYDMPFEEWKDYTQWQRETEGEVTGFLRGLSGAPAMLGQLGAGIVQERAQQYMRAMGGDPIGAATAEVATFKEMGRKVGVGLTQLTDWAGGKISDMVASGRRVGQMQANIVQALRDSGKLTGDPVVDNTTIQQAMEEAKAQGMFEPTQQEAEEDEETGYQRYLRNQAYTRDYMGVTQYSLGGNPITLPDVKKTATNPLTGQVEQPMESTATVAAMAVSPENFIPVGVGALAKVRMLRRFASITGKGFKLGEESAAALDGMIMRGADRLTSKIPLVGDLSLNKRMAALGGVGAAAAYLDTQIDSPVVDFVAKPLIVAGAFLPAVKGAGATLRKVGSASGATWQIIKEMDAGAVGSVRAEAAARMAASGKFNPRYAQYMRSGASGGVESTLRRVSQNADMPETLRRVARSADNIGITQLARGVDDVVSSAAVAGLAATPFALAAPDSETAGAIFGGALMLGGTTGAAGRVIGRRSARTDADIARMMVDVEMAGGDAASLGALSYSGLDMLSAMQGITSGKVDFIPLRAQEYRANADIRASGAETVAGLHIERAADGRAKVYVNMGHTAPIAGRVSVKPVQITRNGKTEEANVVRIKGEDGQSDFTVVPREYPLLVKSGDLVDANAHLARGLSPTKIMPHEIGHAILTSSILNGTMRDDLRNLVNQRYDTPGVESRGREYVTRLVDKDILAGAHDQLPDKLTQQEFDDIASGKQTMADVLKGKPVSDAARQKMIEDRYNEMRERSIADGDNPDGLDVFRDEIVAETFSSLSNNMDFRSMRTGGPQVMESVLAATTRVFETLGMAFNPSTGKPLDNPSVIFRDNPLMQDPVMRKRMQEHLRNYEAWMVGMEQAGAREQRGTQISVDGSAESARRSTHTKLRANENGILENDLIYIDQNGTAQWKSQGVLDQQERGRSAQVGQLYDKNKIVAPNSAEFGLRRTGGGRTIISGPTLPAKFDVLRWFPKHVREMARMLEASRDQGASHIFDYNTIGTGEGGRYRVINRGDVQAILREGAFLGWEATKAGHLKAVIMDLNAFRSAAMKAINKGELGVFNNDMAQVHADLMVYLSNHKAGLPGEATIGQQKRDMLNGLIGTGTAVQRDINPLYTDLNPRGSVRTFRIDRVNDITPTGRDGYHFDYDKIKNNRMPSALPQSGMAMPDTPANLSTDQILRELEENQGYLGLSTLGMREGRPVKGGAQQTRELLKRNTALNEELRRRGGSQEESDVARVLRQRGQAMPDAVREPESQPDANSEQYRYAAPQQDRRQWQKATTGKPATVLAWRADSASQGAGLTQRAIDKIGRQKLWGDGWYGTRDPDIARSIYGGKNGMKQYEVTLQNPYVIESNSMDVGLSVTNEQLASIKAGGHDGIIVKPDTFRLGVHDRTGIEVVVFDNKQPATGRTRGQAMPDVADIDTTKFMVAYRGGPSGKGDFPGTFVSTSQEAAAQYGDVRAVGVPRGLKVLSIDDDAALQLARQYEKKYPADALNDDLTAGESPTDLFMFPRPEWTKMLKQKGYQATQMGEDLFVFDGVKLSDKQYAVGRARGQAMPDAVSESRAAKTLEDLKRTSFIPTKVASEVLGGFPEYLKPVAQFITDQRAKLVEGRISMRDITKAYVMTIASQGSGARAVDVIAGNLAKKGIEFAPTQEFLTTDKKGRAAIRPEEAAAYWLGTEAGQRALNNAERGTFNPNDWQEMVALRKAYGDDRFATLRAFTPENIARIPNVLSEINASKGNTDSVMNAVQKLNGISTGKKGFISHLLGIGDVPTIDAVEINFWLTGRGDVGKLTGKRADLVRSIKKSSGDERVSSELFRRIDNRINGLRDQVQGGAEVAPEVWSHVMHHWLWDKAKKIETTHEGMYKAQAQFMPDAAPIVENFDSANEATGGRLRPVLDQPENAPVAGRITPAQEESIRELDEYYRKVTPQRIKELRNDAIDSLASRLINKGIPVAEARGLATETYKKIKSRVAGASQVISGMGTSDLSRMAGTGRPAVPTRKGVNPNWLTSAFEAFESDNDLALMKAQQVAKQLNKKQQAEVSAGKSVDAARASKVRVSTVDLGMQFLIGEGTADKKAFGSSLREDPAAPPRVYASVVEGQKFGSQGNYAVFFEWKKSSPIVATSHHHYGVGNGLTDIHASANIGDKNARSFGNPEAETYDTLPSGKKVLNTRLLVGNAGLDDIRTHQLLVSIPETALSGVRAMYKKGGFSSVKSQLNDIAVRSLVGTKSQGKTKALTSKDGIPVMVAVQKNRTEAYVLNPDLRNVESITIVENKNKEKDTALIKKNLAAAFKNNGSPLPRIKVVSAESGPSGNPGRKKITDEFFNLTGKVVYGAALGGAAALAADESQQ